MKIIMGNIYGRKHYVVTTTDDMEVKQILGKEYMENWGSLWYLMYVKLGNWCEG